MFRANRLRGCFYVEKAKPHSFSSNNIRRGQKPLSSASKPGLSTTALPFHLETNLASFPLPSLRQGHVMMTVSRNRCNIDISMSIYTLTAPRYIILVR